MNRRSRFVRAERSAIVCLSPMPDAPSPPLSVPVAPIGDLSAQLAEVLGAVKELMTICKNFMDTNNEQMRTINKLLDKQNEYESIIQDLRKSNVCSDPPWRQQDFPPLSDSPTSPSTYLTPDQIRFASALELERNRASMERKRERAVILNIPELDDVCKSTARDEKLVDSIIRELQIPELTAHYDKNMIGFHRHGKVIRREDGLPSMRPIKLDIADKTLRDTFLRGVASRGRKLDALVNFPRAYIRRDLTKEELDLEHAARRRAFDLNQVAGKIEYGVRDLKVIKYIKPREFAQNTNFKPSNNRQVKPNATTSAAASSTASGPSSSTPPTKA